MKHLAIVVILLISAMTSFSQAPEQLQGFWINEQGNRKSEFYKVENAYFGKIIWTAPNTEKPTVGDIVFKNLKWNGREFKGYAATPKQGDISCTISFKSDSEIIIVISKGFISRTVEWTRTDIQASKLIQ
ncbi:MAG: DUF2147 domain-containing protein [Flammeovirgaceae bacterium]|nr:DUF2147 domain-containing protein [Flammeovirgaceae bacterium]